MTAASDGRAPQELFAFIDLKADTDCWLLLSFPLRAVSRFVIHTEIDIMNTGSQIAFQEKDKEEARAAIYFESCMMLLLRGDAFLDPKQCSQHPCPFHLLSSIIQVVAGVCPNPRVLVYEIRSLDASRRESSQRENDSRSTNYFEGESVPRLMRQTLDLPSPTFDAATVI
mmetsp:Transcript_31536/g.65867  ORF Transcript_31536/g.65867 Transcript_31536/m.65867 type:complete len:170 (-) Transcript_31536:365-874(-)